MDADVAHQLGTFVTKSFKDLRRLQNRGEESVLRFCASSLQESQDRSSCLSCSTRPKSYIKKLSSIWERRARRRKRFSSFCVSVCSFSTFSQKAHEESDSVREGPERPQIPDDCGFGPRSRLKSTCLDSAAPLCSFHC